MQCLNRTKTRKMLMHIRVIYGYGNKFRTEKFMRKKSVLVADISIEQFIRTNNAIYDCVPLL